MTAPTSPESRVTVVVSTIRRNQAVERFVASVRRRMPAVRILVADQNERTDAMEEVYRRHRCEPLWLPVDCGLSAARNRALERVESPYALLADDDFVFTEETDLAAAVAVMDEAPDLGFLGGSLIDVSHREGEPAERRLRKWEKFFFHEPRLRTLISVPIDHLPVQARSVAGQTIYGCDMTSNWGLLRRAVFDDGTRWDERIKINGEHEDYFLTLRAHTAWRVAYLPALRCDHEQPVVDGYRKLRRRQGGRDVLGEKWGLTHHLEVGMGLRSFERYRVAVPTPVAHPDIYDPRLGDALAPPSDEVAAALRARVEQLEARVASREDALARLRASRSWRLTAPLRRAARWVRARV